jgi:hypothetical protein
MIIVVILAFDNPVLGLCKIQTASQTTIRYIDFALHILCENNEPSTVIGTSSSSSSSSLKKTDIFKNNSNICFSKSNVLNFLLELFKREQIIKILEK